MKKTFGAAKPLPGQAGYKVTEAEVLEKEAKEMEARLKMLQDRMKLQQLEGEAIVRVGGGSNARWKSSKVEKGSIRAYGKDVVEKHNKKKNEMEGTGDLLLRSSASIKSNGKKSTDELNENFTNKDIEYWSAKDVADYLVSLNLGQYSSMFFDNEISGNVLLDITLEDLDYMQITALGHRKTILKAAETLRKSRRLDVNSLVPIPPSSEEDYENKSVMPKKEVKTTHWSHLEPLSKNEVIDDNNHNSYANAADEESPYDEEVEKMLFQDAVKAWRSGNSNNTNNNNVDDNNKIVIEREYKQQQKDEETYSNSMWKNPFYNNNNNSNTNEYKSNNNNKRTTDDLDEEQEHEEFRKAVEAWRSAPPTTTTTKGGIMSESSATTTITNLTVNNSSSVVVEMLSKQLEMEQEAFLEKLQKQKKEAAYKLRNANEELVKMRENVKLSITSRSTTFTKDEEDDNYNNNNHVEKAYFSSKFSPENNKYIYNSPPTVYDNKFEDSDYEENNYDNNTNNDNKNNIEISLIDSIIGDNNNEENENYYVVEYDSDDNSKHK